MLCVVRLQRADPSFRGVLPNVCPVSAIRCKIAVYIYSEYVARRYQNKVEREKERKKEPMIPVSEKQKMMYA
jgi:hypothetical protein